MENGGIRLTPSTCWGIALSQIQQTATKPKRQKTRRAEAAQERMELAPGKIVAFLAEHPGANVMTVVRGAGAGIAYARYLRVLREMQEQGLIENRHPRRRWCRFFVAGIE